MISLVIKLIIELQKVQKTHNKIIQRQLQMNMIKKILTEKYISLEER